MNSNYAQSNTTCIIYEKQLKIRKYNNPNSINILRQILKYYKILY